jgi:hypothetical protein
MTGGREPVRREVARILESDGGRGGCLSAAGALVTIIILSPLAVAVRFVRRLRRGETTRIRTERSDFTDRLARIDLSVDAVQSRVETTRSSATDVAVRVAESLLRADDVVHMLSRDAAAEETVIVPIGPRVHELGDRFHLALAQGSLAGRTAVWVALPRSRRVVELIDPDSYDPDAEGQLEGLMENSEIRWAVATSFASDDVSTLYRLAFFIPVDSVGTVEAILRRLQH